MDSKLVLGIQKNEERKGRFLIQEIEEEHKNFKRKIRKDSVYSANYTQSFLFNAKSDTKRIFYDERNLEDNTPCTVDSFIFDYNSLDFIIMNDIDNYFKTKNKISLDMKIIFKFTDILLRPEKRNSETICNKSFEKEKLKSHGNFNFVSENNVNKLISSTKTTPITNKTFNKIQKINEKSCRSLEINFHDKKIYNSPSFSPILGNRKLNNEIYLTPSVTPQQIQMKRDKLAKNSFSKIEEQEINTLEVDKIIKNVEIVKNVAKICSNNLEFLSKTNRFQIEKAVIIHYPSTKLFKKCEKCGRVQNIDTILMVNK